MPPKFLGFSQKIICKRDNNRRCLNLSRAASQYKDVGVLHGGPFFKTCIRSSGTRCRSISCGWQGWWCCSTWRTGASVHFPSVRRFLHRYKQELKWKENDFLIQVSVWSINRLFLTLLGICIRRSGSSISGECGPGFGSGLSQSIFFLSKFVLH